MDTVTTSLNTAMASLQSDASGMIGTALPYAIGIAGIVLVVRIGWKVFKSFTK